MSSGRARTVRLVVHKKEAKRVAGQANIAWKRALRAHRLAPPDPQFADRLRATAEAAGRLCDAYAAAGEVELSWKPVRGSADALPPYELRPNTGRRGPEALWGDFDAAVEQLNRAGARGNLADVSTAYAAVARSAVALADALEAGSGL
jgi:hypothetical protein